ncbi:venom phosphodiesterase 2-like [Amphiura filiformis]|uniref:venom phosphodiesterase 2-like n=1 Tax=Amphiura filiformis TaxID=82378 RepID=UPI003B20CE46
MLKGRKNDRRKAEHELMETTLGMLEPNNARSPPRSPSGTATLPSRWQPSHQQQQPQRPPPGRQRPPPVGYRNGSANRPYNSSLSSLPSSTSPRSPGSPNSISSLDSRGNPKKFGTWAPAVPLGTQAAPATLSSGAPNNQFMSLPRRAPPALDHIDGPPDPRQSTQAKPLIKPENRNPVRFQPPKGFNTNRGNKPPQKSKNKNVPGKYKPMQKNFYEKETWVQRHKCLVVSLAIIFLLLFLIAIIVFAIGASGVFGKYFRKTAAVIPINENCTYTCDKNNTYPRAPLILIALDGFQYNYMETYRNQLPNLNTLAECGVKGQMYASYPSTTSPNLWTMVTGYYPQFHGIISDWIRDDVTGKVFDPRVNPNSDALKDPKWYPDHALWEIARKQGKVTASQHWLGDMLGEVEDEHHFGNKIDRSPTYVDNSERSSNYTSRMVQVLDWLRMPINKRPELITVYFEDPGATSRIHGTDSVEVRDTLTAIDASIRYLRTELMKDEILGCVNIMVVSTSGQANTNCNNMYYLTSDFADISHFSLSPNYLGSLGRIKIGRDAPEGMQTPVEVADRLQCKVRGGGAYLPDFLPNRLHAAYGHHLDDVVLMMNEGWLYAGQRSGYNPEDCEGANDGYDPFLDNMKGVFIASGRDFKLGENILPFQNIELFNLMTELIDVEPLYKARASDGSKGMLYDALKNPPTLERESWGLVPASGDQMCQYPSVRRQDTPSLAECTCTAADLNEYAGTEGQTFADMDERLQQNIQDTPESTNAPLGLPGVRDDINKNGEYFCNLYQDNYITRFDRFLKIPTLVSFTLESSNIQNNAMLKAGSCIRYDQRLDPQITPKCSAFSFELDKYQDIIMNTLYHPSLAPGVNAIFDSQITSNIVPQYRRFASEIWSRIYGEFWNWIESSEQVNIVVGPAYDMNSDSMKDSYYEQAESLIWVGDSPLPTHYYVVATRCHINGSIATKIHGCKPEDIQYIAWIFPHVDIPSCFNFFDYLRNNLATLRDVEKLTGQVFYPDLSMGNDETTRLKMIKLKTLYPHDASWTGLSSSSS